MLTLRRNYDFDNVLAREFKIFDTNFVGVKNIQNIRFLSYKNVE